MLFTIFKVNELFILIKTLYYYYEHVINLKYSSFVLKKERFEICLHFCISNRDGIYGDAYRDGICTAHKVYKLCL